jgi:hypothetical protein
MLFSWSGDATPDDEFAARKARLKVVLDWQEGAIMRFQCSAMRLRMFKQVGHIRILA